LVAATPRYVKSVRLVNPDGDLIWTSTQESKGAKYKGSSADVADKCVKQLLRDVQKLEGNNSTQPAAAPAGATAETAQHWAFRSWPWHVIL